MVFGLKGPIQAPNEHWSKPPAQIFTYERNCAAIGRQDIRTLGFCKPGIESMHFRPVLYYGRTGTNMNLEAPGGSQGYFFVLRL